MKSNKRKKTFQMKSDQFYSLLHQKLASQKKQIMNLIEFRRDKLVLNEEAIKIIQNIKEDLIIVFIFGKERTGKTFLMNLLINPEDNKKSQIKFPKISNKNILSSQMNLNSLFDNKKGVYFWTSPLNKENSKEKILFIDTQGLNTNISENDLEYKLLTLILIISSLFIYNTIGDINSNSLNNLQLIMHLNDLINFDQKNIDKDEMISELCPKFIWTLRDFDSEKYKKINKIRDAYLEECLNDDRFKGKNNDEINMINKSLGKYFKKRECVIMPCPVEDEKELANLRKMNLHELNSDFQNEFEVLKKKVYESSEAKSLYGKKITGPFLVNLLQLFITEINNDNIPNIDKIFLNLIKIELDISYNSAKNEFIQNLEKLKQENNIDIKEIYQIKYETINEYMKILENIPEIYNKKNYMKEYEIFKIKLENEIEKMIQKELDILISENTYDKIEEEKEDKEDKKENEKNENNNFNNINDVIENYLNNLFELKMDMTDTILNKKDFDYFVKNDIKKVNDIINFIKTEKNQNLINKENNNNKKENNNKNEIDINSIKLELEKAEKEELELTRNYTQLLEKRDKYLKHSLIHSSFGKQLRSYSNKLLNYSTIEEKEKEIFAGEKDMERCNCNMNTFGKCYIF